MWTVLHTHVYRLLFYTGHDEFNGKKWSAVCFIPPPPFVLVYFVSLTSRSFMQSCVDSEMTCFFLSFFRAPSLRCSVSCLRRQFQSHLLKVWATHHSPDPCMPLTCCWSGTRHPLVCVCCVCVCVCVGGWGWWGVHACNLWKQSRKLILQLCKCVENLCMHDQ